MKINKNMKWNENKLSLLFSTLIILIYPKGYMLSIRLTCNKYII